MLIYIEMRVTRSLPDHAGSFNLSNQHIRQIEGRTKMGGVRFGLFWEIWKAKRSNLKGKKQKLNFSPKD